MNYYQITIIGIVLILTILIFLKLTLNFKLNQAGGYRDPYAWIRPMIIVDFFRNFWFTR